MTASEMTIRAVLGREPGGESESLMAAQSAAIWRDRKRARLARSVERFGRWRARLDRVRAFVGVMVGGILATIVIAVAGTGIALVLAAIGGAFLVGTHR